MSGHGRRKPIIKFCPTGVPFFNFKNSAGRSTAPIYPGIKVSIRIRGIIWREYQISNSLITQSGIQRLPVPGIGCGYVNPTAGCANKKVRKCGMVVIGMKYNYLDRFIWQRGGDIGPRNPIIGTQVDSTPRAGSQGMIGGLIG